MHLITQSFTNYKLMKWVYIKTTTLNLLSQYLELISKLLEK